MNRDNYYLILELSINPPETDSNKIETAIQAKQAAWSRLRNHPTKGRQAQQYLGWLSDIKRVMLNSVRVTQSLSQNAKQLNIGVEAWIAIMAAGTVSWGNDAEPFSKALRLLKGLEAPRFLIVLTDGVWSGQEEAIRCARQCHAEGIEIIAIGFGSADRAFL